MQAGQGQGDLITPGTPPGRAVVDRQTVHVHDLPAAVAEFPLPRTVNSIGSSHGALDAVTSRWRAIGALHIRRREVRPFTEKQIRLLETFADQAVIAIENARLFQEQRGRQPRSSELWSDVTAAADRSLEIKPVLDEVVETITDVSVSAQETPFIVFDRTRKYALAAAHYGLPRMSPWRAVRSANHLLAGSAETGESIHIENVQL